MTDVAKKNLAALGAAAATLLQNRIYSLPAIRDLLFQIEDPDEMEREIVIDELMRDPAFKKISLMRDLRRRGTGPSGETDPEIDWMMKLIEREMGAKEQGPPPMPGMGPGGPMPPGLPPGGPGPMMPNTSATDLSAINPNVGMGAGRPPVPGMPF